MSIKTYVLRCPLIMTLTSILATIFFFSATAWGQNSSFSIDTYLKQCGGKIYSTCNSASLNQESVFNAAKEAAILENKKLMLVIGADWCPACRQFSEMLKTADNKEILFSKVVLVELNGDLSSTKDLAQKLNISYYAYPQAFVLDAQTNAIDKMFYPSSFNNILALTEHLDLQSSSLAQVAKPTKVGSVDVSVLESDIDLTDAYGPSSFYKNPTTLEQKFINQGVAAMHVFHYLDAYRSFNMAAKTNPNAPMAYVGQIMAMTNIDTFTGDYFIKLSSQKLKEISENTNLTDIEKAWVVFGRSLAVSKGASYNQDDLVDTQPMMVTYFNLKTIDQDNYDGLGLITWLLLSSIVDSPERMFQQILQKDPLNAGAHHYLTHIAESRNDVATARHHAHILKDIAKGSAHAQHMYGHTLPQTGNWTEALEYFLLAHDIHMDWAQKYNIAPEQDWHYGHNLDLMAAAYLGLGQFENAIQIWAEAQKFDPRALPHLMALMIINDNKSEADRILSAYENAGYGEYVRPLRKELELTPSRVTDDLFGDSAFDKLMQRIRAEYLARTGKSGDALTDFFGGLLRSNTVSDQVFDQKLASDITSYLAGRFTQGGFDGWSNAYLELLRIKRVARLLSLDDISSALVPLEFTVQGGGLCTSNPDGRSLTPCLD